MVPLAFGIGLGLGFGSGSGSGIHLDIGSAVGVGVGAGVDVGVGVCSGMSSGISLGACAHDIVGIFQVVTRLDHNNLLVADEIYRSLSLCIVAPVDRAMSPLFSWFSGAFRCRDQLRGSGQQATLCAVIH